MNISFNIFSSNLHYLSDKIFFNLNSLQKKVIVVAMAYISCVTIGYFLCRSLNVGYSKRVVDKKREDETDLEEKVKIFTEQSIFKPLLETEISLTSPKENMGEVNELTSKKENQIIENIEILEHFALVCISIFSSDDDSEFSSDEDSPLLDISSAEINSALRALFKVAVDAPFTNQALKNRLKEALITIHYSKDAFLIEENWQASKWDKEEAEGIPSLIASLFNYVYQEVPEEIKELPFWHNESLVLAFSENAKTQIPFSETVINFAEHAVSQSEEKGFYFLLRPSTRLLCSPDFMIFTLTANAKIDEKGDIFHIRIEATQDPKNKNWLFKKLSPLGNEMSLKDLIAFEAGNLPLRPVPSTNEKRLNTSSAI
jgi:hypothetical protein